MCMFLAQNILEIKYIETKKLIIEHIEYSGRVVKTNIPTSYSESPGFKSQEGSRLT
jgi:hypothetical protein